MGLSWQQGPLAPGATGRFPVAGPRPERMLFAEPSRRRMRLRYGGAWIADSDRMERGRAHLRTGVVRTDRAEVCLDGIRLRLEPGQNVISHGVDRDLTRDEAALGRHP
ncbi:hypothetical protein [Streptomyces sp. NBC_00078]|uniref:hypothetical protein n=1 Tax=unclassified Streptomyces TaxID=2593676 RepID=UPI00225467F2|nr:hypothetical protein [Streptomyces sp. NBC_00078]MCX5425436.1 hypothetical protein [Streptomyces sp. NBC_00078]